MSVTYQQEFLRIIQPEMSGLIEADWDEVGHAGLTLDVDWEGYLSIEDRGDLLVFTSRVDGTLVGYFIVVKIPSLQSKGTIFVANEAIFLHKDYRKSRIGLKLFDFAEKCLKEDGHKSLFVTTTEAHPIDKLLVRRGYKKIETRFEKVL